VSRYVERLSGKQSIAKSIYYISEVLITMSPNYRIHQIIYLPGFHLFMILEFFVIYSSLIDRSPLISKDICNINILLLSRKGVLTVLYKQRCTVSNKWKKVSVTSYTDCHVHSLTCCLGL